MLFTVDGLIFVNIEAWLFVVEMEVDVKDDTAAYCWVETVVALEVFC